MQKIPLKRAGSTLVLETRKRVRRGSTTGKEATYKAAASKPSRLIPRPPKIQFKRRVEEPIQGVLVNTTGSATLAPIGVILEGTTDDTRDGGLVRFEFMEWHCLLTRQAASTTSVVRILIFLWKENLVAPIVADIIDDITGITHVTGTYNLNNASQYKILHDKCYNLHAPIFASAGVFGQTSVHVGGKIQLGFPIQYTSNLGNSGLQGIWVVAFSDTTNSASALMQTAITFTDT